MRLSEHGQLQKIQLYAKPNRKVHSAIGEAPIARFLASPDVLRPSPDSAALRLAFTRTDRRIQRRSDGTIVMQGRRFEVPNR
jgi:hypothetical protein